jgi:hypothetical protein
MSKRVQKRFGMLLLASLSVPAGLVFLLGSAEAQSIRPPDFPRMPSMRPPGFRPPGMDSPFPRIGPTIIKTWKCSGCGTSLGTGEGAFAPTDVCPGCNARIINGRPGGSSSPFAPPPGIMQPPNFPPPAFVPPQQNPPVAMNPPEPANNNPPNFPPPNAVAPQFPNAVVPPANNQGNAPPVNPVVQPAAQNAPAAVEEGNSSKALGYVFGGVGLVAGFVGIGLVIVRALGKA